MKKIVNLEKLTDKKFLNLYEGTYHQDNGTVSIWDFASRKNLKGIEDVGAVSKNRVPDAVNIVTYCNDDQGCYFILIREYRSSFDDYFYSFPAGLIEKEETSIVAAIREVTEEVGGRVVEAKELVDFASTSAGVSNECNAVVLAKLDPVHFSEQKLEADEDIQIVKLSIPEITKMLNERKTVFEISTALVLSSFINPISLYD